MIKIGQIGIGHNHGEGKMRAVRKFPELFEVIDYAKKTVNGLYLVYGCETWRTVKTVYN